MGFSLVGPGGAGIYDGIYMSARNNVEIRNGTVRDFPRRGIHESGTGTGHRIINIRVKDNGNCGIYLGGKSYIIERCTAVGNGNNGISAAHGSTVTCNTCYNNTNHGICACAGSTVTCNSCYSNDKDGIETGSGSTVTGNTCCINTDDGISAGHGSTVTGNTCRGNTDHGIYLVGNNLVDQNTATSNGTNMNNPGTCTLGTNHTP